MNTQIPETFADPPTVELIVSEKGLFVGLFVVTRKKVNILGFEPFDECTAVWLCPLTDLVGISIDAPSHTLRACINITYNTPNGQVTRTLKSIPGLCEFRHMGLGEEGFKKAMDLYIKTADHIRPLMALMLGKKD